jgi:hypothetical protein
MLGPQAATFTLRGLRERLAPVAPVWLLSMLEPWLSPAGGDPRIGDDVVLQDQVNTYMRVLTDIAVSRLEHFDLNVLELMRGYCHAAPRPDWQALVAER